MTKTELIEIFRNEDYDHEYHSFSKRNMSQFPTRRSDLYVFCLIDYLIPSSYDMVSAAKHDEIFLGVDLDELAAVATKENIIDLIRCGIRCDSGCLTMFV